MSVLLSIAGASYRGVNRLRRALYRAGVLRAKRLPRPVISIGNIAAGGAGKTPAVIAVARHLSGCGLVVAVLTRGHGRSGAGGVVEGSDAGRYGDEPVLIKKSVENAIVVVGKNRYENGSLIQCDVYLLDDGFQHLGIHRDLDIVIDVERARLWREGRSALADADIVIPRRVRPTGLARVRGQRVFAFSGLADNEQFFAMLRDAGVNVAGTRGFRDHHVYTAADIAALRAAAGNAILVTTEKDAVKIDERDIIAVGIEFEIDAAMLRRIEQVARG